MLKSISSLLAVELKRHLCQRAPKSRMRTTGGRMSNAHVDRIHDYIETAENHFPTVGEIAQLCNMSAVHLRRSFRTTTGYTLTEFIERIRFLKASTLLVDTDLPLKTIAYRIGFSSAASFVTAFRRRQGETPTTYRKRLQF